MALEERVPWKAVKKAWEIRRGEWLAVVGVTVDIGTMVQHLLVLESMLKTEALAQAWAVHKAAWRARLAACTAPAELERAVGEFEAAVQWSRYLVGPDGRPLTQAEIASGVGLIGGSTSAPLPPPLSRSAPPEPPEGVPRAAARMLLLLQGMGVSQFDPNVAVQLLDIMHGWTTSTLLDASANSRMRVLSTAHPQVRQQLALQPEPPLEHLDIELAVRARAEHQFTRVAAREVLAQHAADTNAEPMPILPRRPVVALPTSAAEVVPSAWPLIQRGVSLDDDENDMLRGALIVNRPPPPAERSRSHRASAAAAAPYAAGWGGLGDGGGAHATRGGVAEGGLGGAASLFASHKREHPDAAGHAAGARKQGRH